MLTGETGAGKSILLGALSLIMGERVDSKTVRDASRKLVVEATFDIAGFSLGDFFAEADIDYIEHECILRREVAPGGRSRAFVNDTPVPVTTLRELTTMLIDIHSQHSNMALSQPRFQLNILDSMKNYRYVILDVRFEKGYNSDVDSDKKMSAILIIFFHILYCFNFDCKVTNNF